MSESFIGLPPDSTGKKLRTFQWVIGPNTVQGESQVICDPADGTAITITTVSGLRRLGTEAAQGPAAPITAPWPVQLSNGATAIGVLANPLRVDPTGTTPQPVTGTLTVNIGTTGGLALEATLLTRASEATLATRATEATLATRASEATLAVLTGTVVASLDTTLSSRATEATLATRASEATLAVLTGTVVASLDTTLSSRATEATLATRASEATLATRAAAATQTDGTQRTKVTDGVTNAAVKAAATAAVAADPALVVAISPNNTVAVTAPVLTKGTQGANGFSVQELHDAGRVSKVLQNTSIIGVVAETLLSLVMLSNLVAAAAATSYTVTAGKILRLTGLLVTWTNGTAALGSVTIRVRAAAAAPAVIASPVIATVAAFSSAGTVGSSGSQFFPFVEGFELAAGAGVGLTQQARTAVAGFDVQLIGYEY